MHGVDKATGEVLGYDPSDARAALAEIFIEPRETVIATFETEDLRALLARCLAFTATDPRAAPALTHVRIDVSETWARGMALNGIAGASQKVSCEATRAGRLTLSANDAGAILRMLPRPNTKRALGPVTVEFVTGGPEHADRWVMVAYRAVGRAWHYQARNESVTVPDILEVVSEALGADVAPADSRVAMDPQLVALVMSATAAAKDQPPVLVRWHLVQQSEPDVPPLMVARFTSEPSEFVAVLMPMHVTWEVADTLHAVRGRMRDLEAAGGGLGGQARMDLDGGND